MNKQLDAMKLRAKDVGNLLHSLSNERRLLILCQLSDGEKSVGEIARQLDIRHSAVSQQLALLRKDALVQTRRDAQTVYYSLARDDVRRLIAFLYGEFCTE